MAAPSKAYNVNDITHVLLPDGWHPVEPGSFQVHATQLILPDAITRHTFPTAWCSFIEPGVGQHTATMAYDKFAFRIRDNG